ncbi:MULTISPECIES: D-sedoheptulose 7-phosphate isomerase [Acidobacterium]|uniref:D-sedoheptulose-7-phosphate isomerase n=1 Tax=Acidobacterium TaxID=33973 RepID=UPI000312FC09|nr:MULTISPECIES: D-sedoheptulose 7-phosphate isomerase [Acidobacterium]HCT59943.1 SIS domain-containing protein [Acidobacterium sp.]
MNDNLLTHESFEDAIASHLRTVELFRDQREVVEQIGTIMLHSLRQGGKILWCGNGGSAADAQHLAAEIVGRFKRNRKGMPSIALTTDTSILTAVANDFGYDCVFQRQVEALCAPEDVLVAISTSGNSRSVCAAVEAAKAVGAATIGFTGAKGGTLASLADVALCVQSEETARIQEVHILCGHILCDWIETAAMDQLAREIREA